MSYLLVYYVVVVENTLLTLFTVCNPDSNPDSNPGQKPYLPIETHPTRLEKTNQNKPKQNKTDTFGLVLFY